MCRSLTALANCLRKFGSTCRRDKNDGRPLGEVLYPVPWAREPSISYLVTPDARFPRVFGSAN